MIYDEYREQIEAIHKQYAHLQAPTRPTEPSRLGTLSREEASVYFDARDQYDQQLAAFRQQLDQKERQLGAISSVIHQRMGETYLPDHPELRVIVGSQAYDRGHSAGLSEIELHYAEFAQFALEIINAHGRKKC